MWVHQTKAINRFKLFQMTEVAFPYDEGTKEHPYVDDYLQQS